MKLEHKRNALNRLKTVRGHLNAVIGMVESERYCPETMKQVSLQVYMPGLCRLDAITWSAARTFDQFVCEYAS